MNESRDPSRTSQIDWAARRSPSSAWAASSSGYSNGRRSGPAIRSCSGALAIGVFSLVLLLIVERRARNPMLPLALFRSRTFTLANVLTLLLYAALGVVLFLVPLDLIQVQHYTATAAGAALPAVSADHVRAVAMVGRPGRARRQPAAPDRRTRRLPRSVSRCTRGRESAAPTGRRSFRRWSCSGSGWRSRSRL